MKWKVTVIQTVLESATVEVEAESEDAARRLAVEGVEGGEIEVDWDFFDTVEEPVKAWIAEKIAEGQSA